MVLELRLSDVVQRTYRLVRFICLRLCYTLYITLYWIVLHCIVLYCTALSCIVLRCVRFYCIVLYWIAHCIVLHWIVLNCVALYCKCIVLTCIVLCYIISYIMLYLIHVSYHILLRMRYFESYYRALNYSRYTPWWHSRSQGLDSKMSGTLF